jgi:ketosteroid isomerase-like protein
VRTLAAPADAGRPERRSIKRPESPTGKRHRPGATPWVSCPPQRALHDESRRKEALTHHARFSYKAVARRNPPHPPASARKQQSSASRGYLVTVSGILAAVMSEESTTPDLVELMGRAFEAANRRDLDAVASSFAEAATFDGRALGDHFQGRPAIRSFLEDWFGAYEELEFGLEEVRDLGNGVVFAVVVQNGRPAGSAGHLRQREGWVFVWVRGLIARLTTSEVDEAHAAAELLAQERTGG